MLPTTTTALLLLVAQLCSRGTAAPTTPNNLKVVVFNAKPFSFLDVENAQSDDQAQYSGVLIDLFKEIAGRLNISYEFYQVPDGKYGSQDDNGQWHGLIKELLDGNADIAVAPLTITPDRAKVVRFGRPLVPAGIVPIIKRPAAGQQLPFTTIDELVANTDLLYGSVKDGATYQYFDKAPNASISAFIGQQMNARSDEVMARSYEEGVKRVREGGYVFFGEQYSLELMASRAPCNLMLVGGNPITLRHYAFAFRKEATDLADQFDQVLIEQEWDVNRLITKYWEPQCSKPSICMCDSTKRKEFFTKETGESNGKEEVEPRQEENDDDTREEEERNEDKTGNEEDKTEKTDQEQHEADQDEPEEKEQDQPETSTVESDTVTEQTENEVVPEEKNDEVESPAESESSVVEPEESSKQEESTDPPTLSQEATEATEQGAETEGTEQGAENANDDITPSDSKNETSSEL